ncbi:sugar-binding protein [Phycisphaerales bacterium AB-hyl4]|uniref:Sugar-binding protein n=1 Tax=Natronomicrosphaera hydrolytica TaxID=3242702 RepID=A0ABV4U4G1_9BACT
MIQKQVAGLVMVILSLSLPVSALAQHAAAVASVPLVERGPTMDGGTDDAVWRTISEQHSLTNADGTRTIDAATRFRVCTDGQWLYFLVEAAHPRPTELDRTNLGRDRITWDETVEIFIAPDPQAPRYYHFALAPGGSNYDAIEQAPGTDWDSSWKHHSTITEDGWVAAIAIPLRELGLVEGVKIGDRLAVNVCRTTEAASRHQNWSPTGGVFHQRQAMGEFIIGSYQDAAMANARQLREQINTAAASERIQKDTSAQSALRELTRTSNELQAEAARIRSAEQWRGMEKRRSDLLNELRAVLSGNNPMFIWQVNPWDLPAMDDLPGAEVEQNTHLTGEAFQKEHLTLAFGVANLSNAPVRFRILPSEWARLGSTDRAAAADHLTVRRVTEVAISGGSILRDALPQLRIEDEVTLLPGSHAVIWLTVNTRDMTAGVWRSNLTLVPLLAPDMRKDVALQTTIYPAALPDGPRPYSANWAYYENPPSSVNREAAYQDQREHHTNIHYLPGYAASGLGSLSYDDQGKPRDDPDFSILDEWIDRFGDRGQFYIFRMDYPRLPAEMGGKDNLDDPQARENFRWWVTKVREHFESRGMSVRDFAWYAADEPDLEGAHQVRKFGTLMQSADPQQQIYVTVYQAQRVEWLEIMAPYVNVWTMKFNISKEQRDFLLAQDARYFSYNVLPNTSSPYFSYRREAMLAKVYDSEGIGFWSYEDTGIPRDGSTSWIPKSATSYAVIYEGQDGVVPSVRWEAWRQGIQDFRYVEWLETLVEASSDATLASQGRTLAAQTPQHILDSRDRTTADRSMAELRRIITQLLVADGSVEQEQVDRLVRASPLCLTGNDTLQLYENLDNVSRYRYSVAPSDDPDQTRLTDGNMQYPSGWVLFNGAPETWAVTFDLQRPWQLSHLDFLADVNPFVPNVRHFTVYLSETGREDDWVKIDEVTLRHEPGTDVLRADAGRMRKDHFIGMELDAMRARYLRLEMKTPGYARLGEVRIYGWAEE